MLEILLVYFLSKKNGEIALSRGRKPTMFKVLTFVFWFVLEFIGGFIGAVMELGYGAYLVALLCAGLGALIAYLIAANCAKGDYQEYAHMINNQQWPAAGQQQYSQQGQQYYQQGQQPYPPQGQQYSSAPKGQEGLDPDMRDAPLPKDPEDIL